MKQQLHRSITFWAGILMMVFLFWGWCDSLQATSYLRIDRWQLSNGVSGLMIESKGSLVRLAARVTPHHSVSLGRIEPPAKSNQIAPGPAPHWLRGRNETTAVLIDIGKPPWLGTAGWPRPAWTGHRDYFENRLAFDGPGNWLLFLPHWLLLLAFAPLWTGLVLWRTRRRKQTIIAQAAQSPVQNPP